jgi:hypothetical protein
MKLISLLTTSLFLNTFLLGYIVRANEANNLSTNNQNNSTLISQDTSWNRTATIEVEVINTKPTAELEKGFWDAPPYEKPDLAICIEDESFPNQRQCVPDNIQPQQLSNALCEDAYRCNFPDVSLPSGQFKIIIVDVDVVVNDIIGYGNCDVNSECQVGQARIKISAISENTIGSQDKVPELPNGLTEAEVDRQAEAHGFPEAQYPYFSPPNGCGPGNSWWRYHGTPNGPLGAYPVNLIRKYLIDGKDVFTFKESCNEHDICYISGNQKDICDRDLYKALQFQCSSLLLTNRKECLLTADAFYYAVRTESSKTSYQNASQNQKKYITFLRQYIDTWQQNTPSSNSSNSSNDTNLLQTKPKQPDNSNEPVTEPLWGEPENIPETNESSPPTDPLF